MANWDKSRLILSFMKNFNTCIVFLLSIVLYLRYDMLSGLRGTFWVPYVPFYL